MSDRDRASRPRRNIDDDELDDDLELDDDDDGGSGRERGRGRGGARFGGRRRRGTYCPEGKCFNYKEIDALKRQITEAGKIKPRRQTGNCSRCQRELAREVKRARHLALLPFVAATE